MTIALAEVGAFPSFATGALQIRFGVYLPGVRAVDGFEVVVRLIHKDDRFNPNIPTQNAALTWNAAHPLSLWSATVGVPAAASTNFGNEGTYLYRFQLFFTSGGVKTLVTEWFPDPFARETDAGEISAVTALRNPPPEAWTDETYKTPELDDLVVYELQVEQFNDTFQGVIDRIPYLRSLGVNCVELMPVTSPKMEFDWGYGPLNYFAPASRFGDPAGLRALVDACHAADVAVILDVVYQHVDPAFPYHQIYCDIQATRGAPAITSPMIDGTGQFGPQIDYSKTFAQDYVATANQYFLDEYHVDGFRYDEVTDLYDGPTGQAYALVAFRTYLHSLGLARFQRGAESYSRIIQCAEALGIAPVVLRNTYTSCAWQDDLLNGAEAILSRQTGPSDAFAHTLDPLFAARYPATKTVVDAAGAPVDMPVAPFQYLNSHDHSHLIVFAGTTGSGFFPMGDRSHVWRQQPFAIALLTSQGVPMLWEGEEICDNYNLPGDGSARVNLRRDMNWEYFYDDYGSALIRVYRRAGRLRRTTRALRSRQSFYYNQQSLQGTPILAYHRHAPADGADAEQYAMVVLNFGDTGATIENLPFPKAGVWTEQIDADVRAAAGTPPFTLHVAAAGDVQSIAVPSNYGYVFVL